MFGELVAFRIVVCHRCLDGVGEECHTPGCALWLTEIDVGVSEALSRAREIDTNAHDLEDDS